MFLFLSCNHLWPIYWSHVLSWEWRWSWSSADRRCSNYIGVINNLVVYKGAPYIRDFTVSWFAVITDDKLTLFCHVNHWETLNEKHNFSFWLTALISDSITDSNQNTKWFPHRNVIAFVSWQPWFIILVTSTQCGLVMSYGVKADAIWRQSSQSTLIKVMACCLKPPSH